MITESQLSTFGFRQLSVSSGAFGRPGHYIFATEYIVKEPLTDREFHKVEIRNDPLDPGECPRGCWRTCYTVEDIFRALEGLTYFQTYTEMKNTVNINNVINKQDSISG